MLCLSCLVHILENTKHALDDSVDSGMECFEALQKRKFQIQILSWPSSFFPRLMQLFTQEELEQLGSSSQINCTQGSGAQTNAISPTGLLLAWKVKKFLAVSYV